MSWVERICHVYDIKRVDDGKHFLLECFAYTHIKSQFQNICYNTNLTNLLTHQIYGDLIILLLNIFEHRNKIVKKTK
jgi:hypothetical protein